MVQARRKELSILMNNSYSNFYVIGSNHEKIGYFLVVLFFHVLVGCSNNKKKRQSFECQFVSFNTHHDY